MELEYTKYQTKDGAFYRPSIDITFKYKSEHFPYASALIDTGSDMIMLPLGIAEVLGAEPDFERVTELQCACGGTFKSYASRLPLELIIDQKGFRSMSWQTHVQFVESNVTVLLGHRGFLDRFDITFYGKQHMMKITSKNVS